MDDDNAGLQPRLEASEDRFHPQAADVSNIARDIAASVAGSGDRSFAIYGIVQMLEISVVQQARIADHLASIDRWGIVVEGRA